MALGFQVFSSSSIYVFLPERNFYVLGIHNLVVDLVSDGKYWKIEILISLYQVCGILLSLLDSVL